MKSRKPLPNLDVRRFMRRHWQREPALVRGAFPGFVDPLSRDQVFALASKPDCSARLVRRRGASWTVEHGPFSIQRLKRLPRRDWTVLVQDTNRFSRASDALLGRFDFIPHARIDDVMVSYAAPGGGVGPHVDSYDVFLLQGAGRRRWRISRQPDRELVAGMPLKILADFVPEEEWVLEAGDMLYLPPGVAHDGVAETECLTWSIGFRAPSDAEITAGFLDFLQEKLAPEGHYGDAGATASSHPGEIPPALEAHFARALRAVRWTRADVREFAGRFLTEPKAQVVFEPPRRALARAAFERAGMARGVALDPGSRLGFSGTMFFLNGEAVAVAAPARAAMRRLADARRLEPPVEAPPRFWDTLHEWYRRGYVALERKEA